jgi:uncharacterized protein YdbL (DUF1318 family)
VFFREPVPIPEQDIAEFAAQIEEVVLNVKLDDPSPALIGAESEEIADGDLIVAMIDADEIRRMVPAMEKLGVDNHVMQTAIRSRALRRPAVKEFEQNGCVGENNRGLLQYLKTESCPNDRDMRRRAGYLVLRENRDRRTIYDQIIEANDLGASALEPIRRIFAEQIHKKAWAGTPLEMPDGAWKRR